MAQTSSTLIFTFSTLDFPEKDRFHAWVKDNHCDCRLQDDDSFAFNAAATGAALGPLILSGRRWLNQDRAAAYEVRRTERLIRTRWPRFLSVHPGYARPLSLSMDKSSIGQGGG